METVSDWVEGGAPEGNPKHLPDPPKPEKWLDAATPKNSVEIAAGTGTKLESPSQIVAIRPTQIQKGASIQVIAMKPDGTVEPLLWIYQYNPDYQRTYYYKKPENLPAGTEIQTSPPDAGKVALFAKRTVKSTSAGAR